MKSHSCRPYPIESHFRGKKHAKALYEHLISRLRKAVGPFITVSPQYGIELLKGRKRKGGIGMPKNRFLCIRTHEKGLELSFALDKTPKSPRACQAFSLGFNRLLDNHISTNVLSKEGIDRTLLGWLKKAYDEASG